MPQKNILSLHLVNESKNGDVSIFLVFQVLEKLLYQQTQIKNLLVMMSIVGLMMVYLILKVVVMLNV